MNQSIDANISRWLSLAWKVFTGDLVRYLILSLIYCIFLILMKPTFFVTLLVCGPLLCGIYHVILKKLRGNPLEIGEIAEGFKVFIPAFLAYLVLTAFKMVALAFCFFPVILVRALYLFTFPLIVDQRLDFWTAMETSRRVTMGRFGEFLLFELVLTLIELFCLLLSFCTCGVGIILYVFVVPFVWNARAVAYEEVFQAVRS